MEANATVAELNAAIYSVGVVIHALESIDRAERHAARPLMQEDLQDVQAATLGHRVMAVLSTRQHVHGHVVQLATKLSALRPARWHAELCVLARLAVAVNAGLRRASDEAALGAMLESLMAAVAAEHASAEERDTLNGMPTPTVPAPAATSDDRASRHPILPAPLHD